MQISSTQYHKKNIRKYLDKDTTHMLIKSLALSHLDYTNSLLMGLQVKTIKIMQNIQNLAAKVILGKQKSDSFKECFKTLPWLPIKYRINCKVCTLVFKCLHAMAPTYLINLIKIKQQRTRIEIRKHKQHSRNTQNEKENICIVSLQCIWTTNMECTTRLTENNK